MTSYLDAYNNFLDRKIKCANCGVGPSKFTTIQDSSQNEKKIVEKYFNFCSFGCIINSNKKSESSDKCN